MPELSGWKRIKDMNIKREPIAQDLVLNIAGHNILIEFNSNCYNEERFLSLINSVVAGERQYLYTLRHKKTELDARLKFIFVDENFDLSKEYRKGDYPLHESEIGSMVSWFDKIKNRTEGLLFIENKKKQLMDRDKNLLRFVIRRFTYSTFLFSNSLVFHAAGVSREGKGVMFVAESGGGKSTVCDLSEGRQVLHDDGILLRNINGKFYLFPLDRYFDEMVALESIIFISKDSDNRLEEIAFKYALAELLQQNVNMGYLNINRFKGKIFERIADLLKSVFYNRLYFKKDSSFWNLIERNEDGGRC